MELLVITPMSLLLTKRTLYFDSLFGSYIAWT
jgi:hypothetical protein